ncbi:MAG: ABC transporter substrate-binding protein, partial [Bacteroidetes bacterium]|nr:ABC transporter substrate-binding protein [Bacteroidota bacterium]
MTIFTDQLNRKIEIPFPPKRIISLVPSQTELLYDLGLRDEVVGITKFCVHPEEWFKSKTKVGGTKKYNFEKIKQLQPDLIIGNKEENEKEQIEELMKHYPVWMSDIYNLKDALSMIACIGALVGRNEAATNLKLQIESQFHQFNIRPSPIVNRKSVYFIWRKPY